MVSLKVLSTAAVVALALPLIAPSESFAQQGGRGHAGFSAGGGVRVGGGAARVGGNFAAGPRVSGNFAATTGPRVAAGGYRSGGWNGAGGWNGGYRHYGGRGFVPGAVAGAVVGGALASSYAYYGGPGYYDPGYYDDSYYYDDAPVAVEAAPGGGDPAYCAQLYRSYDPASGTYLGYDGERHPCP